MSKFEHDYLLVVGTNIWKQRRAGELPVPGTQVFLHDAIPLAAVVSVMEDPGQPTGAALLRFPESLSPEKPVNTSAWEKILASLGWTALVPDGLPPVARARTTVSRT